MNIRGRWRWLNLVVILAMLLMLVPGLAGAEKPVAEGPREPGPPSASPPNQPPPSAEGFLSKLHPDLRKLAQRAAPALPAELGVQAGEAEEPVLIEVLASPDSQQKLSAYFVGGKLLARPPFGKERAKTQVFFGYTYPSRLLKIASLAQVQALLPVVLERNAEPMPYPPDQERQFPKKGPEDWAHLKANAERLREGSRPWDQAKAFGDGGPDLRAQDWFEVAPEGPHKARTAWQRGYRGAGVTVAVLDDGIDAAHPDLMGTQRIYSSTAASYYNGWPMVFSPFSMLLYALDTFYGTSYIANGYDSAHYVDTRTTPALTAGTYTSSLTYRPLLSYGARGLTHTYTISNSMTKSGVVHVGTHPDNDLRDFIWGEKVAVLVADPNTAGVYDTVYVDLDDDYDFRDEKPLSRANTSNPTTLAATYNNMVAYRDMTGDGLADLSGGMLYFIADGQRPIPVSDWMWGGLVPGNGNLVAFSGGTFDRPYSHGTQCASNIVGQGVVNGMLPSFADLGGGAPSAAVFGMAPEAKVVNVSDIYFNFASSIIDAYIFAAIGYDGRDQTIITDTDAIQITSNSYGASDQDNDGWEYEGQVVSQLQRQLAPYLQFLFSTGNGAPAYGTTAPPSPATGIAVGASTEFGSTGWDSITYTSQIMFNDVIPFSNRGPSARGTSGVDVVAGGAFAAGDEELNYYAASMWGVLDGNLSWASWGGTSRSAPVAAGVLALIYQAYRQANGTWPTYDWAQALLMSTATDLNYDTLTQGAGSVNADRGTAVAGGHYGLFAEGSAPTWEPGRYRGADYPGFAHIAYPGDVFTKALTIRNTGPQTITASVSDAELRLIRSQEFTFTITPAMVAAESAYGSANRDNFFKAFNYFIPITATAAKIISNSTWAGIPIPPGTDLMIIRQMFPYDQFDPNGDYSLDNRYYLTVYNWKDVNGDGNVWEDKDSNGVVNFINDTVVSQIDGAVELRWNDTRTELDRWEFGRFGYHRPGGNRLEMWVRDPAGRMIDGLFIGLRHHPSSTYTGTTILRHRVEFYREEDVSWLAESTSNLSIAPGASATFVATATMPADMPPGIYQAAIQVRDPGWITYTADTAVIPVALNVAAAFTGGLQLGGMTSFTYDQGRPYNNGVVRGLFDWTWRAESGDWRFFFADVPEGTYPAGTKLLVRDEWNDAAPHTDIDTIILGPTPTSLGAGWYDFAEPSFYGPYVLDTVGKSPNTYLGSGKWRFDTSSGTNKDWMAAPLQAGLHALLEHNVLNEGLRFDVVFTKTLGTLQVAPGSLSVYVYGDSGRVGTVGLTATVALSGLVAEGFGLAAPEYLVNQPISFLGTSIEWTRTFTVTHGGKIELWTSSPNVADIDLYLYYCGPAGAGPCTLRASSAGATAREYLKVLRPEDGVWLIGVDNYSGPAGHFNLTKKVLQGYDLTATGVPTGTITPNTPIAFAVNFSRTMTLDQTYEGMLLVGPAEAPQLLEIPVAIIRTTWRNYLPAVFKERSF